MKKTYIKPDYFAESFQLSQAIAACYVTRPSDGYNYANHWTIDTCAWVTEAGHVFTLDNLKCDADNKLDDPDDDSSICYHTPTPGNVAFSS